MGELDRLRTTQSKAAALAVRELNKFWRVYGGAPAQQLRDALLEFVPALVDQFGDIAATAAAEWYEQARQKALGGSTQARLADVNLEAVEKSVRWAVGDLFQDNSEGARSKLARSVERHVRNVGRDTIQRNIDIDPAKPSWARVLGSGEACAFCRMLASRGFVYGSEDKAGAGAHAYHDSCECVQVPDFAFTRSEREELEKEIAGLYQEYLEARQTGGSVQGVVRKLRTQQPYRPATRDFAEQIVQDLSEEQRDALFVWSTNEGHKPIQAYLRGSSALSIEEYRLVSRVDALMEEVMKNQQLGQNLQLFRVEHGGIAFDIEDLSKIGDIVGEQFEWKGYTATTWPGNPDPIARAKANDIAVTLLAPKQARGLPIAKLSRFEAEGEVLLNKGLKVKVLSAWYDPSTNIAEATVQVIP